jgi:hypothetical protein
MVYMTKAAMEIHENALLRGLLMGRSRLPYISNIHVL